MTVQRSLLYGREYELPEEQAKEYIRKGLAVPVTPEKPKVETTAAKTVKETRRKTTK
jgi:hypothetical protein